MLLAFGKSRTESDDDVGNYDAPKSVDCHLGENQPDRCVGTIKILDGGAKEGQAK